MKNIKTKIPAAIAIIIFVFAGCSKLDEKLQDRLTLKQVEESTAGTTVDVSALLTESYKTLNNFNGGGDVNFDPGPMLIDYQRIVERIEKIKGHRLQ